MAQTLIFVLQSLDLQLQPRDGTLILTNLSLSVIFLLFLVGTFFDDDHELLLRLIMKIQNASDKLVLYGTLDAHDESQVE